MKRQKQEVLAGTKAASSSYRGCVDTQKVTPKALAKFQPRVAATLGLQCNPHHSQTLKEFPKTPLDPFANAFSVMILWLNNPRVAATLDWNWSTPSA
jgi:hypothetical protein